MEKPVTWKTFQISPERAIKAVCRMVHVHLWILVVPRNGCGIPKYV